MERAELGVDGDCAFALLGNNLQEGEAEFVRIETKAPIWSSEWHYSAVKAATTAYRKLQARLSDKQFSYFLGSSHPGRC